MQYEIVKTGSIKTWYCIRRGNWESTPSTLFDLMEIIDVAAGYQTLLNKDHYMIATRIHPKTQVVLVCRVFSLPIFDLHSKRLAISAWVNSVKVTRVP